MVVYLNAVDQAVDGLPSIAKRYDRQMHFTLPGVYAVFSW